MATTTHVINLTRKTQRIGTTVLPKKGPGAPTPVAIDLDALGNWGRHDLQALIASGSVVAGASATSLKVANIAMGQRVRVGATKVNELAQVTLNPTTMTGYARRDLIQLLASGSLLQGDTSGAATVTLYNLSSKRIRIGSKFIAPKRTAGSYKATDVITLTNLAAAASSSTANTGFKLTYNAVETSAFQVNGAGGAAMTAANIQSVLRTATGDTGLTVTGTTDTGPFTVTYSDGFVPLSPITVTHGSKGTVATLVGFGGTDSFKITYNSIEGSAITRGTNYTAAQIQALLRTQTSDAGLIVQDGAGFTDTGFTVIYSPGFDPLTALTVTSPSGCTGTFAPTTQVAGTDSESSAAPAALLIPDVTALTEPQQRDLQLAMAAGQVLAKA